VSKAEEERRRGDDDRTIELMSEFGWVRVSLDRCGRGPRLLIEDLEAGESVLLDPLELASMCHSTDEQRREWLRTGPYADAGDTP
jgi:hypothetical protein